MIRKRVRIPDDLFHRAKRVAAAKEWSFAEVVRRGLEYVVQFNPPDRLAGEEWHLPAPVMMGLPLAPEEEWTALSRDLRPSPR